MHDAPVNLNSTPDDGGTASLDAVLNAGPRDGGLAASNRLPKPPIQMSFSARC
jgi:hypothetical protein